jgi:hypothetical protein
VSVVDRVTANQVAEIVAVVPTVTAEVLTANAPLDAPPLTTVSAGTWTTAGLLLDSWTVAPFVTPVKATVSVAGLPPVTLDGITDTDDKDRPDGGLTGRCALRALKLRATWGARTQRNYNCCRSMSTTPYLRRYDETARA